MDTLELPGICVNGMPVSSNLPSTRAMNLKVMSFKELSYTLLADFGDKNDQKTQFLNVMEELVRRYFELGTSTIGKSLLEFLIGMFEFPNHALLLEKADVLLQELRDFSNSARQEVAALEEAIEEYIDNANPVFSGVSDQFFEEDEEEAKSDSCIGDKENLGREIAEELREADMNSISELLTQGLNTTIEKLRRRSTLESRSSRSSGSMKG